MNTAPDVLYEVQSATSLAQMTQQGWTSEGFVSGSEITNWTATSMPLIQEGCSFFRIRSWQDTTGTGIPDWWWWYYFGQITNVNANASAAGDGYSNLQKFQMGLNPTNYYNPNPPPGFFGSFDATGTNVVLDWSPAPGPVLDYVVQRGILNANTDNYLYSQAGILGSNAVFFRDVGAINNPNAINNIYNLTAVYPGGNVSGTDTWQAASYSSENDQGPPDGPPFPGNVYAYAESTGTNVLLSWTPALGAATSFLIERGIYDPTNGGFDFFPIAQTNTNTTAYRVVGAITNLTNWGDAYAVVAVYAGGGLSWAPASASSINPGPATGTAAPSGLTGYMDATGTNLVLTWNPASGQVTNYLVFGGNLDWGLMQYDWSFSEYEYAPLGKWTNGPTSFEVTGGIDGYGNSLYEVYCVVAVFADGSMSQAAQWYSDFGGDFSSLNTLSAYVDSTGTNVVLSWTPAQGNVIGYIIQRSVDYGNDFAQITNVIASTNAFVDIDGITNVLDYGLDSVVYSLQATYPDGGLSPIITASIAANPPAPTGLSATVDSTGTNVTLSWTQAAGVVSDYIIERGTYNPNTGYSFSQIGTVGSGTNSFEDVGALGSGNNNNNTLYQVVANYGGGLLSAPDASALNQLSSSPQSNLKVSAQWVRNESGRWQLMFSSIPPSVQTIAFYWYIWDYFYDWTVSDPQFDGSADQSFSTENDIPVSSITNGIYVLPDFLMTNWFPNSARGKVAMVQPIGTNNEFGQILEVGFQPYDSPVLVDGREALKQNLLFELRAATISQPIGWLYEDNIDYQPGFINVNIPADTNYVESSIFHWAYMFKGYGAPGVEYIAMDDVWPFTVNYELHQNLYDPTYAGPSTFPWETNLANSFGGGYGPMNLSFQGNLAAIPAPPVLGVSDPYWIAQNMGDLADLGASESGGSFFYQGGVNLFGMDFQAALVNNGNPIITVDPGNSVAQSNVICFYTQTDDPSLLFVNYYFAPVITPGTALTSEATPVQPYPLPAHTGFANSNQTGVLIASVGNPIVIGGWAREKVIGTSAKFAYLGQYFMTNAWMLGTNGTLTTNTTGVVSPYGDFFPTEPGLVALKTMPDIDDTNQQGTGVVAIISLNVDADHDGIMDFTYNGPDFVSANNPFRFWVNDDEDSGDDGGNGGIPGQAYPLADGLNYSSVDDLTGEGIYPVHGRRDLVDFFPVYVNIGSVLQSNSLGLAISVTDTNYQFVLSQADGVLRFVYTDLTPTNYLDFLQDLTESGNLAAAITTTITPGGVMLSRAFLSGIAGNDQGIILVEAAQSTTNPLVLQIFEGSNLLAQTSLYLSISGVEQMFRHKNLMLDPNATAPPDRLTDASVPNEPPTNDKNFVFVHGYNVNTNQARGWCSDIYKRMYWSGSHAKFYGVAWDAYESQADAYGALTPDLQTNVVNAFLTAPKLAAFLATLNNGPTVVAAHSLGNMLVLSALSDCHAAVNQYFMIDAAVAIEALQGSAAQDTNMVHPAWLSYTTNVWASEWHGLFPPVDGRNALTWRDRLSPNLPTANIYNFYSSGEEVLREHVGWPPDGIGATVGLEIAWLFARQPVGVYAWAWQEKSKGCATFDVVLSSTHGGWKFNTNSYGYTGPGGVRIPYDANDAALLTTNQLQTNAFFDVTSPNFGYADTALFGSGGSQYAQTYRARLLSDTFPALTLPAGANVVTNLEQPGIIHNFDVQALYENGWPVSRGKPQWPPNTTALGEWHHSDIRAVAYTFTYPLFDKLVVTGNLQ